MGRCWKTLCSRIITAAMIASLFIGSGFVFAQSTASAVGSTCNLGTADGNMKHVIYVQFDNVHFTRDNPNVPSDLEQMPNLLNFIKDNGTLLSKQHTPLIAHTATDILTTLTGVYGDRHGVPVSNSYGYFNPDGSTSFSSSFAYWTAPVSASDPNYNMITPSKTNTPAPWVPYTRAGCNVGSVAMANTVIENTKRDIPVIFGANSPEAAELKANPDLAYNDFMGIAVHCASGDHMCVASNSGKSDLLPNEPGGYTDFNALFGHKYVAPQISPNGPLTDLDGNVIKDSSSGNVGFPGFDAMTPAVSLSYVAAMQEHGVPVTYAYISDAHDPHVDGASAYGPGDAGYVAALKSYDQAFGKFFTRLAQDGINKSNTLFVFTADENDHFAGGSPSPANCDGVSIPCTYAKIGEVSTNLTGLLATQQGVTTPFDLHNDTAPTVYIKGNPARDASVTRTFERAVGDITVNNPISGQNEKLANYLADPVEMQLLHMVTSDPARTPTFTLFAKPDYYVSTGASNCNKPCTYENPAYAWMHGDFAPDINTTWLGLVGPGVRNMGINDDVWADHTDTRPTMMALLGLKDDYVHDGRVLFEILRDKVLPDAVLDHKHLYIHLAEVYKEINAPVNRLGQVTLKISTMALQGDDQAYTTLEQQLQSITTVRNTIASQMVSILESAEFGNSDQSAKADSLIAQANALLQQAHDLAY